MKKWLISFFVIFLSFISVAHAQAPCTSIKDCEDLRKEWLASDLNPSTRNQINNLIDKQLQILAKYWPNTNIINGVKWSKVVKGTHNNLSLDLDRSVVNGIIQQSQATEACRKIGGRLPTKEEFNGLKDHWDDESVVSATFKQSMNGKKFWSSSATSYLNVDAFYFGGSDASIQRDNRVISKSVRCVPVVRVSN